MPYWKSEGGLWAVRGMGEVGREDGVGTGGSGRSEDRWGSEDGLRLRRGSEHGVWMAGWVRRGSEDGLWTVHG